MRLVMTIVLTLAAGLATCAAGAPAGKKPISGPDIIEIPAGAFIFGSDRAEREAGYRLDEAA